VDIDKVVRALGFEAWVAGKTNDEYDVTLITVDSKGPSGLGYTGKGDSIENAFAIAIDNWAEDTYYDY